MFLILCRRASQLPDIEQLINDCDNVRGALPDLVAVAPLLKVVPDPVNNKTVKTTIPA